MKTRHCYLIRLQFLGFRYSGWQKQPGQKTLEGMLLKTLKFVFPDQKLKILGAGRTDAKVSAVEAAFQLFLEGEPLMDLEQFLEEVNYNLPPDIKIIDISVLNKNFNIINQAKSKQYHYFFSFGQKNHPFCAPFMANFLGGLDISRMQQAAALYVGEHYFRSYTTRSPGNRQFLRTINQCEILENKWLSASFFPEKSYVLVISGKGFMRYQIRMIMGALVQVGQGELTIGTIKESLLKDNEIKLSFVAPGSGLVLHKLEFDSLPG